MSNQNSETTKLKSLKRNMLIISGLKVFCEKGYKSATIDDIVKKANCSHGLFYHYFKTKKELFNAILEKKSEKTENQITEILEKNISTIQKLEQLITLFFDGFSKNENFAYYFYFFMSNLFILKHTDISKLSEEFDISSLKKKHNLKMVLETLFKEGQDKNEITKEYTAKECANLFHTIIQGATLNYITLAQKDNDEMILPNINFILSIFKNKD